MSESLLPIYKHENEILSQLETSRVIVVIGEPGSGKTTQIPQILLKRYEDARIVRYVNSAFTHLFNKLDILHIYGSSLSMATHLLMLSSPSLQ